MHSRIIANTNKYSKVKPNLNPRKHIALVMHTFSPVHMRIGNKIEFLTIMNNGGNIVHKTRTIKNKSFSQNIFCFHYSDPKHFEFVNYFN